MEQTEPGYWSITVYALGFEDTTVDFEVTEDNIVDTVITTENADTSKLEALVKMIRHKRS